jgi:hypothetical protein
MPKMPRLEFCSPRDVLPLLVPMAGCHSSCRKLFTVRELGSEQLCSSSLKSSAFLGSVDCFSRTKEIARSSETSVIFHRLSSRNITEDMDRHRQYQHLRSGNNDCRHFHLLSDYFPRILDSVPILCPVSFTTFTPPRTNRCPCSVAVVAHRTSCSREALSCLSCKWIAGI